MESFILKQVLLKTKKGMTSTVTEVVVYQLKADKVSHYANISTMANNFLKQQKGFISRKVLQDHKDATIFMDIVEWETLADAQNAIQASEQEQTLLPFFEATDKIITLNHYALFK